MDAEHEEPEDQDAEREPVRVGPVVVGVREVDAVELGREVFVGFLNDGDFGTFETTYRFQAKFAGGAELFGRCQHPIVEGSGTRGFLGATGRLDFKDIIEEPITFVYRGHIRLP